MTPRYRLRTLLILLAIVPPLLWIGWGKYQVWKAERDRQRALRESVQQQCVTIWLEGASRPTIIDRVYLKGKK
jgi:hypothetical protein